MGVCSGDYVKLRARSSHSHNVETLRYIVLIIGRTRFASDICIDIAPAGRRNNSRTHTVSVLLLDVYKLLSHKWLKKRAYLRSAVRGRLGLADLHQRRRRWIVV